jgi:hypothetical protein
VLALDRFADFIGDEAVAPVRETCVQIIGLIISNFNNNNNTNVITSLCNIINIFITTPSSTTTSITNWELRHSGIMALKYIVGASIATSATKSFLLPIVFSLCFDNILKCIKDTDDDVRQVATATLEPVSSYISQFLSQNQINNLLKCLIQVIEDNNDDLSTSCGTVMSLLSNLLQNNCGRVENTKTLLEIIESSSVVSRLLPYLFHASLQVKEITLTTINNLIISINEYESHKGSMTFYEKIEKPEVIIILFRLLFQQSILMSSECCCNKLGPLIENTWTTLCKTITLKRLIEICFPFITTWLLLLNHSQQIPIDSCYLIDHTGNTSTINNEYIGSNQIRFEDKSFRDLIIIKCRLLASKLLAILFNEINKDQNDIKSIVDFLCRQISFKSGLQRFNFSLIVYQWSKINNKGKLIKI